MKATRATSANRHLGPSAVAATLFIAPPLAILAIDIVRHLQPAQFEPARTATILFTWIGGWMTQPLAAVLFLLLPLVASATGAAMLATHWCATPRLRADAGAAAALVRRNLAAIILAAATMAAALVLTASLWHLIAG